MDLYPDLQVSDQMVTGGGNWNYPMNQLLEPEDVALVRILTLRSGLGKDKAIWYSTKSGDYTVKSGYKMA